MGMIDMTEGQADYLKYRFKQWLGSVARAIQNRRLEEIRQQDEKIDTSKSDQGKVY